jgi:hypothetical protein
MVKLFLLFFLVTISLEQKIDCLLSQVAASDATFIRNGKSHTGPEAADHMRKKYQHFKKKIKTVDDFIDKAGSRSLLTRRPYRIKPKDEEELPAADWLRRLAAEKCL